MQIMHITKWNEDGIIIILTNRRRLQTVSNFAYMGTIVTKNGTIYTY